MARETKTITVVHCTKYDEELPALDRPPFPGPLGERIYENVSKLAYKEWNAYQTTLINHYGLNMADPRANDFIFQQMEAFFFGGDQLTPIAGAPAGKGAAPARK